MDYQSLTSYLNQYFNYIRKIFLSEYSRYLSDKKIEEINNMSDVFRLKDNKFKIYNDDKINICLDIKSFIKENNLINDNGLKDIDISAKIYVKFLIDNKEDVDRLILSTILRPIVAYLIKPGNDVITNGLVDDITDKLNKEYNIKYEKPFESKEAEIFNLLKQIIGNKIYKVLFDHDKISKIYNNSNYDIENVIESLNSEYLIHKKRMGKVFYSDTLYDYQTINYEKEKNIFKDIIDGINENNYIKTERIKSVERCIDSLLKNITLFDLNDEQMIRYYADLVKNIVNKLNDNNVNDIYLKILELEDKLKTFTNKVWKNYITNIDSYDEEKNFNFVVGNSKSDLVEARFLSKIILENIDTKLKYNYGYIYDVSNIVYATGNDILVRKAIVRNENVITYNNSNIEIDNQKDSKIMTPELVIKDSVKNKTFGNIVLYEPKIIAVFAFCENETDYDYEKASELSENMELPLIKINKKSLKKVEILDFETKKEEVKKLKEVVIPTPKMKLKDKIKNLKNSILYEEGEEKKIS